MRKKEVVDNSILVCTSEEHDIENIVKTEIQTAIKNKIDELSTKYYRNIDVKFEATIK